MKRNRTPWRLIVHHTDPLYTKVYKCAYRWLWRRRLVG